MVGIVEVSPRDGLQNERALLETGAKIELIERAAFTAASTSSVPPSGMVAQFCPV